MKKILLALFGSLMSVILYGQGFAVSSDKMNVVYVGVDNPLTIVAEGCDCSKLIVSTEDGKLEKTADCAYNFRPGIAGKQDIAVKVKTANGIKNLGSVTYRVKNIPDPVASLLSAGHQDMNFFRVKGIVARLDGFDFETTFTVKDFIVEVVRKNKIIHTVMNEGSFFSEEVRKIINTLYPGDRIIITDVRCIGPDNVIRRINTITYVLQ